jgi:hypothetical protein
MEGSPALIPAGTTFAASDLIHWADPEHRSLEDAIAEADLLVTGPHASAEVPAELAGFLDAGFTRRLQFDFTDVSTGPVARTWAGLDRRTIYVEDPHPRLVRDANRPRPDDLGASLREAFERVRSAGAGQKVDLKGVDAIRPVTFAFHPVFVEPTDDSGWNEMVATFEEVGARGIDVYERTRDELLDRLVEARLRAGRDSGAPRRLLTLSLHDTMNHTARVDGAVAVERPEADRLPAIVALSNRGDERGDARGEEPVSMAPELVRRLADAHRGAFGAVASTDVVLNHPYLGGHETTTGGIALGGLADRAAEAGVQLGAVQAEFRREFLLGDVTAAEMMEPGTGWPAINEDRARLLARELRDAWDRFRQPD